MSDCLVLNKDGQPLSMLPLSVIGWQTAIRLLTLNKIRVIKDHEHWIVRSPNLTMHVPSVVITTDYVKWSRHVKYNRSNIFMRDSFTCQYCGDQHFQSHLTLDHVIPRSHGGKSCWNNISTACKKCNSKKGNDASIKPKIMPYKPSYYELASKRRTFPINIRDTYWKNFLKWDDSLITLHPVSNTLK